MNTEPDSRSCRGRIAGILAHISSLPSPWGIGDLGKGAYGFLDFLTSAGQRCWQFLPLYPVSAVFGYSPYMSSSTFACNPMLISPELLWRSGLLDRREIDSHPEFSEYLVDFKAVDIWKRELLKRAFARFISGPGAASRCRRLDEFIVSESWVGNYALFEAIREHYEGQTWNRWPEELAAFTPHGIEKAGRIFKDDVQFHAFVQLMFHEQWQELRNRALDVGIRLFGDMPFYVAYDSADVWGNQSCFCLDPSTRLPVTVAGVPPDYFSVTGQRWGNPLYRWEDGNNINFHLYEWWRDRFSRTAAMMDMIRIDHFRGFEAYWSIPADEETAVRGKWIKGPGEKFFNQIMGNADLSVEIIAEDLGTITPEVECLRKQLGFPGMKVLQFAFDSDSTNPYLPHNFTDTNAVVYTGTHDNDTVVGWYLDPASGVENKARARRYANSDGSSIHRDFVRMAYASIARIAIVPLQDALGFGSDCRMNTPGLADNNWRWRCAGRFLNDEVTEYLRHEAMFYGRC